MFLRNAWYVGGTTAELNDQKMIALTMLGEPVVIYRKSNGEAVALENRCVHRLAPLSLGRVEGDNLICMYHGLLSCDQCQAPAIPGQNLRPNRAYTRSTRKSHT